MRLRKLAGTTAGALVLGALSVPMTMSAAHAAPVSAQTTFSTVCTYSVFSVPVEGNLDVTVNGKSVVANLDATANFNVPAGGLKTSKLGMQMTVLINGESVAVKGETTFTPPKESNEEMPVPAMVGTRTGTAYPSAFDVTAGQLDLTITYGTGTATCDVTAFAPVNFPPKPQACVAAEAALPVAVSGHSAATSAVSTEAANVKVAATKASKANAAVTKAAKAVKKATKAVKKAKAKKAKAKAKKAVTKAKKAQSKAKSQLKTAKTQLAAANKKAAAANSTLAATGAAVAAAQAAVTNAC